MDVNDNDTNTTTTTEPAPATQEPATAGDAVGKVIETAEGQQEQSPAATQEPAKTATQTIEDALKEPAEGEQKPADGEAKEGEGQKPAGPTDEDYLKEIGDEDFEVYKDPDGNSVKASVREAKAVAPLLRKLGVPPSQVKGVMGVYSVIDKARADNEARRLDDVVEAKAKVLKEELGEDLDREMTDMVRGAKAVFPPDLWAEIKEAKPLLYDVRFVRGLAAMGRKVAIDDGTGGSGTGSRKSMAEDFSVARWTASKATADRQ